ncbi:MAG: M56 family metallopeptidase [Acutalibacteraceae bacterium]
MKTFVISLIFRSLIMSAVSALYALTVKKIGETYSPKWRFLSYKILLLSFLVFLPSFGKKHIIEVSDSAVNATIINSSSNTFAFNFYKLLFIIWILGAAIYILKAFLSHVSFMSKLNASSQPVCDREILNFINENSVTKRKCSAVIYQNASTPMSIGVFHPIIILPDDFETDENSVFALLHELNHIKRFDTVFRFAEILCAAVHWFNPYIPLFLKNAEHECEVSCDEMTVKDFTQSQKENYCRLLISCAGRKTPPCASATAFSLSGEKLKNRMSEILFSKSRKTLCVLSVLLTLLCSVSAFAVGTKSTKNIVESADVTYTTFLYESEEFINTTSVSVFQNEAQINYSDSYLTSSDTGQVTYTTAVSIPDDETHIYYTTTVPAQFDTTVSATAEAAN